MRAGCALVGMRWRMRSVRFHSFILLRLMESVFAEMVW